MGARSSAQPSPAAGTGARRGGGASPAAQQVALRDSSWRRAAPRPGRGGAGGPGDRVCPRCCVKNGPANQRILPLKDCGLFISGGLFPFSVYLSFFFFFIILFLFPPQTLECFFAPHFNLHLR